MMPDEYDKAVEHLTKNPHEIYDAWLDPDLHLAGALFGWCGPRMEYGCLTQVHGFMGRAATLELTDAIRADDRIPDDPDDITVEMLPVFAEWQRKIDAMGLR